MAIRSLDYLKGKFEDGDRPTGADFSDLVESTLNSSITSLSASGVEKLRVFSEGVSAVGNLYTTGDINVDGNITAKGTLTLGDADTDNVTFNADVNSNVLPDANNTYNLGSSGKTWANVYGYNLSAYNVVEAGQDIILAGTSLQDTYVNVTGDTMTGALSTPTLSASKVEVNGNIKIGNSGGGSQLEYDTVNFYVSDLRNNGTIKFGVLNGKVAIGGTNTVDNEDVTVTGSSYLSGNVTTTGNVSGAGTLTVDGESTLASAIISDLTEDRLLIAGSNGAVEDSANITYDDTTLTVNSDISASGTIKTDTTLSATKVDVDGNIKLGNDGGGGQLQYNTTNFYIADLKNDNIKIGILNGKVAIGGTTVANDAALTVNGILSCGALSADGDIKIGNGGTTNKLIYDSTNLEIFGATGGIGTNLGIFNGQVGINTTDVGGSGESLTVQGNTLKRGTDITTDTLTVSADSTKGLYIRQSTGDYSSAITSFENAGNFYLYGPGATNANDYDINLRGGNYSSYISAGNFGLGTTDPDEKLTVQGTVSASGFKSAGETGQTTTITVSTASGDQTLTFTNGILTNVA